MDRRGFVRVATAGALGLLASRSALASLARALPVEELIARSQHVLVGEPLDAESVWEQIGQRRHIVTYTRVRTLEPLAGADPHQEELLVRTLGGRVGDLGELVHGEAMLEVGARGVLFVMPTRGALAITAILTALRLNDTVATDGTWQLWIAGQIHVGASLCRDIVETNPPLWF